MFSNPFHKDKGQKGDEGDLPIDIDDLTAKLEAAEGRIRGLISGAVPKVEVSLPRIPASAFDGLGGAAPAPRGFAAVPQDLEMVPGSSAGGTGSASQVLLGNVAPATKEAGQATAKTTEGAAEAAEAGAADLEALLGDEHARLQAAAASEAATISERIEATRRWVRTTFDQQKHTARAKVEELRAPITSALSSLVFTLVVAIAGFGPAIAIFASVVATTAGFAASLHTRAHGIRTILLAQLDNAVQKVLECVGKAKTVLLGLSSDVVDAIDGMCEEQKPALDKAKQLEDTLKVDIPDPSDMKKPLDACKDRLLDVAKQAEDQVPQGVRDLLNTLTIGKVINDEKQFNFLVVMLPTAGVFLLNATFGAVQFALHCQHALAQAQGMTAEGAVSGRHLRGADPLQGLDRQVAGMAWSNYLSPWFGQVALMFLQVALAMAISSAPRLLPYANDAIEKVEASASDKINSRIQGAVDAVMKNVFDEVKEKCDDFFPKFKNVLGKIKDAQELAEKAGALAGAAKNLRGMF